MDLNGRILYLPTRLGSFDTIPSVVWDTPSEETNIESEKNVVQIGISFSKGSFSGTMFFGFPRQLPTSPAKLPRAKCRSKDLTVLGEKLTSLERRTHQATPRDCCFAPPRCSMYDVFT